MVAELIGEHLAANEIQVAEVKRFGCTRPT